MRISAEAAADRVFDELAAAVKLDWRQLAQRTGMTRGQINNGIRWLRDTLGDNALITHADHTYALALSPGDVRAYQQRRVYFYAKSLLRLKKVIQAGVRKFDDPDLMLSVQLIGTAVSLLKREAGNQRDDDRTLERVH